MLFGYFILSHFRWIYSLHTGYLRVQCTCASIFLKCRKFPHQEEWRRHLHLLGDGGWWRWHVSLQCRDKSSSRRQGEGHVGGQWPSWNKRRGKRIYRVPHLLGLIIDHQDHDTCPTRILGSHNTISCLDSSLNFSTLFCSILILKSRLFPTNL